MRATALIIISAFILIATSLIAASTYIGCPIPFMREVLLVLSCLFGSSLAWAIWIPYLRALSKSKRRRRRKTQTALAEESDYFGLQFSDLSAISDVSAIDPPGLMDPVLEEVPTAELPIDHVQEYVKAADELWRMERDSVDDPARMNYLCQLMSEHWALMSLYDRERAELQAADAWKRV